VKQSGIGLTLISLLLAACSVSISTPAVPPSGSGSPSPAVSASATPATGSQLSCRLPVWRSGAGESPQGVFINLPSDDLTVDPGGKGGRYYDRSFSRWLPVEGKAVSSDGRRYFYGERAAAEGKPSRLHVVDVSTGADRVTEVVMSAWFLTYQSLEFANEGIYLSLSWEGSTGLWLMDPQTGVIRRIAELPRIQAVSGGAAWVGSVNPTDPNPVVGLEGQPDQLDRVDLVTGARVTWLYRPGSAVYMIGSDRDGHPLVSVRKGDEKGLPTAGLPAEIMLLTGPGTSRQVFSGTNQVVERMGPAMADSHGTWIQGADGFHLYTEGSGLRAVSSHRGVPAGACQ
jgi:hypothetical protein